MLILSRRESERVHLGDDIVLTIVRVNGDKVRIGVEAPSHIKILRTELELNSNDSASVAEPKSIRRAA
jgi:carbon storage regulator